MQRRQAAAAVPSGRSRDITESEFEVSRRRTGPEAPTFTAFRAAEPVILDREEDDPDVPEERRYARDTPLATFAPSDSCADRATLTVLSGPDAGVTIAIDEEEIVLGRSDGASVQIDEPSISRRHARISRGGDGLYRVEDLGSTNGTFVGGRRLDRIAPLVSGQRIQLGPRCILRFAIVDAEEETLQRNLYQSATRDTLTGILNRKCLLERLETEFLHARRADGSLAVLMLDLDHFKDVNDTYGHIVGDLVLRAVAGRAAQIVRAGDVFARFGGEEFVVVARNADRDEAFALAERIRQAVAEIRIDAAGDGIGITVSIGAATLAECDVTLDARALLELADMRLYGAKLRGRNRVCVE